MFDYRIYTELSLIRTLGTIDVPLSELRRILEVRRSGICNCVAIKTKLKSQLAGIEQRIEVLHQMRLELAELLEEWQACGGAKPAARP